MAITAKKLQEQVKEIGGMRGLSFTVSLFKPCKPWAGAHLKGELLNCYFFGLSLTFYKCDIDKYVEALSSLVNEEISTNRRTEVKCQFCGNKVRVANRGE